MQTGRLGIRFYFLTSYYWFIIFRILAMVIWFNLMISFQVTFQWAFWELQMKDVEYCETWWKDEMKSSRIGSKPRSLLDIVIVKKTEFEISSIVPFEFLQNWLWRLEYRENWENEDIQLELHSKFAQLIV